MVSKNDKNHRCGANTKSGKPCQARVKKKGSRCRHHPRLTARSVVKIAIRVCGATVAVAETYQGMQFIYEHVWPVIQSIGAGLLPEDFWYHGVAMKDLERMHRELNEANRNQNAFIARLGSYPESELERLSDYFGRASRILANASP